MADHNFLPPEPDNRQRFLACLRESLDRDTFVKLVLGKYRGRNPG